ncbi:unnamed protein product [Lupinus luteus]|uniref:Uncharacterized protein n=1 Tax=Lupinus luteus TaxID=3873 RepID=A0AAV1Y7M6_LUPLU
MRRSLSRHAMPAQGRWEVLSPTKLGEHWRSILPYLGQYERCSPNWKRSLGSAIPGCFYRLLVIQSISIRFPQAIGE